MKIPVFPLNGAVLFPKTNLPLNIFEDRYIDMVDFSLANKRLIGMIQNKENDGLYSVGCYGKITVFNETSDNRYLINLEGINCFKIIEEVNTTHKFRIFEVETIERFNENDLDEKLKHKILDTFKKYNDYKKLNVSLGDTNDLRLVDVLKLIVMISPFDINIKQMCLELKSNKELYHGVLSTLEIELASKQQNNLIN